MQTLAREIRFKVPQQAAAYHDRISYTKQKPLGWQKSNYHVFPEILKFPNTMSLKRRVQQEDTAAQ